MIADSSHILSVSVSAERMGAILNGSPHYDKNVLTNPENLLCIDAEGKYRVTGANPHTADICDYNDGVFPFVPRFFSYIRFSCGLQSVLVEVSRITSIPFNVSWDKRSATWIIRYHLGKIVENQK